MSGRMLATVARAICLAQTQETRLWQAFLPEASAAIEAVAAHIETDFGWSDRLGVDSKIDKCQHGIYGWEDCEQCITDFLHRASKPPEPTP